MTRSGIQPVSHRSIFFLLMSTYAGRLHPNTLCDVWRVSQEIGSKTYQHQIFYLSFEHHTEIESRDHAHECRQLEGIAEVSVAGKRRRNRP